MIAIVLVLAGWAGTDRVSALPVNRIAEAGVVGIELDELLQPSGMDQFLDAGRVAHGPGIVAFPGNPFVKGTDLFSSRQDRSVLNQRK